VLLKLFLGLIWIFFLIHVHLQMEHPYTWTLINVNNESNFIFSDDSHFKFEPSIKIFKMFQNPLWSLLCIQASPQLPFYASNFLVICTQLHFGIKTWICT
jgi:hypothetical protein